VGLAWRPAGGDDSARPRLDFGGIGRVIIVHFAAGRIVSAVAYRMVHPDALGAAD